MNVDERYARWLGSYFFVAGADSEDLAQEARIAMLCAPAGLERIAAKRRILDILKSAQRRPSFAELVELEAPDNVADIVDARGRIRVVVAAVRTDNEHEALRRIFCGEPVEVGPGGKAVAVALSRFRRRLLGVTT